MFMHPHFKFPGGLIKKKLQEPNKSAPHVQSLQSNSSYQQDKLKEKIGSWTNKIQADSKCGRSKRMGAAEILLAASHVTLSAPSLVAAMM